MSGIETNSAAEEEYCIGLELVWVRLLFVHEKEFYGVLLNEPYKDYGCHEGTIIGLVVARLKEKPILLFHGRTAEAVK